MFILFNEIEEQQRVVNEWMVEWMWNIKNKNAEKKS